jgi:hypothetical protein
MDIPEDVQLDMWYIARGNKRHGPVTKEAIERNWYSGHVRKDDMVFSYCTGGWIPIDQCEEFVHLFPKIPKFQEKVIAPEILSPSFNDDTATIGAGYIFAILSWMFCPIAFAAVTCAVGIYNICKPNNSRTSGHGVVQIVLGITGVFVNMMVAQYSANQEFERIQNNFQREMRNVFR